MSHKLRSYPRWFNTAKEVYGMTLLSAIMADTHRLCGFVCDMRRTKNAMADAIRVFYMFMENSIPYGNRTAILIYGYMAQICLFG